MHTTTTTTHRLIVRCTKCGDARGVEATDDAVRDAGRAGYVTGTSQATFRLHRWNGRVVGNHLLARCPACGAATKTAEAVRGTYSDHLCDSRCMGASGPVCECSCGGANHGGRHMPPEWRAQRIAGASFDTRPHRHVAAVAGAQVSLW